MKNLFVILTLITSASLVHAQAAKAVPTANFEVTDGRVFAPLKGSNTTAGYGTIKNTSSAPLTVRLVKASLFKAAELHESKGAEGHMSMNKLDQVVIAPHQVFEFKPGGHHIMLFDPLRELKVGESVKLVFNVNGQDQEASFKVVPRTEDMSHHHMHM